jgi:putative FmdB family regulatory protein
MPLYEYQCDTCAHRFEVIQKFSDAPLEACPKCGGTVKKLLSSPAIQFKGSGWYITDYARKGESAPATASEAKTTGTDTKTDAKTDTKADAKTETKPTSGS